MEAIRIENLTKSYGDTVAVKNLSLCIQRGELLSLLGVNGAGKTTTVKMLSCLIRPTEGDAYLGGKSIVLEPEEVKKKIGVSPQETAIAAGLTVRENLSLMCGVRGFSRQKEKEKICELSALLGLDEILNKKAKKLSGGWQRRLSIAMALIGEPEFLFLDEPTLGLDVLARSELWDRIRALKGNVTILLTTHYMEEAEALSDRVAILKDGVLLACDRVSAIKDMAAAQTLEEAFVRIVRGVVA